MGRLCTLLACLAPYYRPARAGSTDPTGAGCRANEERGAESLDTPPYGAFHPRGIVSRRPGYMFQRSRRTE